MSGEIIHEEFRYSLLDEAERGVRFIRYTNTDGEHSYAIEWWRDIYGDEIGLSPAEWSRMLESLGGTVESRGASDVSGSQT